MNQLNNKNDRKEEIRNNLIKIRNTIVVENGELNASIVVKQLLKMLDKNIAGLEHVNYDDLSITEESSNSILDHLLNAFEEIQGALEVIDIDENENTWRCPFSNRIMHKSIKLNNLRQSMIFTQKKVYESLNHIVIFPASYLTEKLEDFYESDFKFKFHNK